MAAKPLTPEQQALIQKNYGYAIHWVRLFLNRNPSLRHMEDDLQQAAFLGMVRSASSFSHTGGASFCTYSTIQIRSAVLQVCQRAYAVNAPKGRASNRITYPEQAEVEEADRLEQAPSESVEMSLRDAETLRRRLLEEMETTARAMSRQSPFLAKKYLNASRAMDIHIRRLMGHRLDDIGKDLGMSKQGVYRALRTHTADIERIVDEIRTEVNQQQEG